MTTPSKSDAILKLAGEILSDLDLNTLPLEHIISKTKKLARIHHDDETLKWLTLELTGYANTSLPHGISAEEAEKLAHKSGRYTLIKALKAPQKLDLRKLPPETQELYKDRYMYYTQSAPELEILIRTSEENLKTIIPPHNFTPAVNKGSIAGDGWQMVQENYGDILKKIQTHKQGIQTDIATKKMILARIRDSVYTYVSKIYLNLEYGAVTENIFEQARRLVNHEFTQKCPEAINQLIATYERLASGNSEEWAQALTSCRRILKTFADSTFPAQSTPYIYNGNKELDVSDDKYINRIWAFIDKEITSNSRKDYLKARIGDIGSRVEAIYDMTNKGIHGEVSQLDVNMCVIDTYLFIGNLLQLKK